MILIFSHKLKQAKAKKPSKVLYEREGGILPAHESRTGSSEAVVMVQDESLSKTEPEDQIYDNVREIGESNLACMTEVDEIVRDECLSKKEPAAPLYSVWGQTGEKIVPSMAAGDEHFRDEVLSKKKPADPVYSVWGQARENNLSPAAEDDEGVYENSNGLYTDGSSVKDGPNGQCEDIYENQASEGDFDDLYSRLDRD
jgi:hypothetical protein